MGLMTLEDFRSDLLFDLKNRTDTLTPDGMDTTRQDRWINQGYFHVSYPNIFRHRQLQYTASITLIAGQSNYIFSPDPLGVTINGIRSVTHLDSSLTRFTKLLPRDQQWFVSRSPQDGAPREYFTEANEINFNTIPTANEAGDLIGISAWREPIPLVAGAATVLGSHWDEIVLLAARWRAELHLGYREIAQTTKLDFVSLINEYKSHEDLMGEDWDWQAEVRTESSMDRM
jgi:hypothetical protein